MRILYDIANLSFIQIIVFGGLFLGLFYFTMYDNGNSLKKSIEATRAENQQVSAQVRKKKKEMTDIKLFQREISTQEEAVNYFLNFIPSDLTFTDVSALLNKEAKTSGVNINLKQDERVTQMEGTDYHILNVRLTVSGAFSQILLFLSKLTDQKQVLIVDKIGMKVNRTTELVEADLNISAYRYQPKEEEEEEEKKQS